MTVRLTLAERYTYEEEMARVLLMKRIGDAIDEVFQQKEMEHATSQTTHHDGNHSRQV